MAKKEAKKQDRATEYTTLKNGCKFTPPYINPSNWESGKASVNKPWFVKFTYHDPMRGTMEVKRRAGNKYKTLPERQDAARQHLQDTLEDLEKGVNPFTGKIELLPDLPGTNDVATRSDDPQVEAGDNAKIITINTPLMDALRWAEKNATWGDKTRIDTRSYMSLIYPAIRILKYENIPLEKIVYQHIDQILAQTYKATTKYHPKWKRDVAFTWSNYQKNRAKDYLSSHFGVMKKKRVITNNPCSGMDDLPWETKEENEYSPAELREITRLLWEADQDYAIFMLLFYDSGARETEFMKLKDTDIDLENQVFKRQILKGQHKKKKKGNPTPKGVISDAALPYWRFVLSRCKPGEYLFSRGFRPGPKPIRVDNINTRWREIVKPHFPNSRPYLMKHTSLTDVTDELGDTAAIALAGWTTDQMLKKVYDKRRDKRNHEILRKKTNLHLLGAPGIQSTALSTTANCAMASFNSPLSAQSSRIRCYSCTFVVIAPTKLYKSLAAA